MKIVFKIVLIVALLFFFAQSSFAWVTNHIDSFETTSGILFGVDKYCGIERANKYSTEGKFSVKLSFNTNYQDVVRNFFLPEVTNNKKIDESLLFDAYNKSGKNIILFYKIFFAGNKNVEESTKLIKYKGTTVEIPFALVRTNIATITGYQFYITNNVKEGSIYFDNFRTERASFAPFKKIAYFDLSEELIQTDNFYFTRGLLGQVFKNTIPLPFEKIKEIKLTAAKGEMINYPFSFRTDKKQKSISVNLSDFISKETNIFPLTTSIGKVKYLDKRLTYDSKFYVADMPMYIEKGNSFTNLNARTTRTFWFTLEIPETAEPGGYTANVIIDSVTGGITNKNTIPVSLCVLPFAVTENLLSKEIVYNCDPESIKPEIGRYVSGFFKISGGSNGIIKTSPHKIKGDVLDDFDGNAGDRTTVFTSNKISIAYYAACAGNNDLQYLEILNNLLKNRASQKTHLEEIKFAEENIKYLIGSIKTTPPINVASKWTAMLTKEQVDLIGKPRDTTAVAFVTCEQKLPNGWSSKDYDRARVLLANSISGLIKESDTNLVSTSFPSRISFLRSISIPLSRGKARKKKRDTVYSVRELFSIPELDSEVNKKEWRNSLKVKRFSKIDGKNNTDTHTEAWLGWYDSNFYVQVNCYESKNNDDLVELYIKPGNENKIWNKLSVNSDGVKKSIKSDGKLWIQNIDVQSAKNDDCLSVGFSIPLSNCLTHSSDFGLNICRKESGNTYAWKAFTKNRLKFSHIKLNGAEKIVNTLIDPIKSEPLKIISSDAFAFGNEDFISVEAEWDGERRLLKKSSFEIKIIGIDKKEYITRVTTPPLPRQKIYLKLNDFIPGIYKLYVVLMDSSKEVISTAETKIKIMKSCKSLTSIK